VTVRRRPPYMYEEWRAGDDARPAFMAPDRDGVAVEAYQDGGMFYCEAYGEVLADYSHCVHGDYDLVGAQIARRAFLRARPDAWMWAGPGHGLYGAARNGTALGGPEDRQ
jgi:hypothetical protein